MNTDPLNKYIKKYYANQSLSDDKMKDLITLGKLSRTEEESENGKSSYWMRRWQYQKHLSIAASVSFVIVTMVLMQSLINPGLVPLPLRVAHEIALNHNKQLPSEFSASTYIQLGSIMIDLDFIPTASSRLAQYSYHMDGARYCSIQGQLAAQTRLVDSQGNVYTLYQTQYSETLAKLSESEHVVDGVKVKVWREKDMVFGLAESFDDNLRR